MNSRLRLLVAERDTIGVNFALDAVDEDVAQKLRIIATNRFERDHALYGRQLAEQNRIESEIGSRIDKDVQTVTEDRGSRMR